METIHHTCILINHHRIPCICSCILNAFMHLFLNVNIKQKKSRISKRKNIAYILNALMRLFLNVNIKQKNQEYQKRKILHTFVHSCTYLTFFKIYFETLLMRSWSQPHFFQNFIWDPLDTVKVLTSLENRKTRANKIIS